jgi:hypothetical protein
VDGRNKSGHDDLGLSLYSAARRAAMIWSAVRPVNSAM